MLVDINWIVSVQKRIAQINSQDIKEIEWIKDGKKVCFTNEELEGFQFTGLNNTDILKMYTPKPLEGGE